MKSYLAESQLVTDLLDLLRLRVQPLAHYRYPWWQPALLITLLGVFAASTAEFMVAPALARIAYFVCLNWFELLLMTHFFHWWMQLGGRWNGEGSLLQLMAVCQGVQILEPLLTWLPDPVAVSASLLLAGYSIVMLVHALAAATHVARSHVMGGILLFTPVALALYLAMMMVANQFGWIAEPPAAAKKSSQPAVPRPNADSPAQGKTSF